MSRWRLPLVAALAWLAVVTVGSAAVWWVISSVGEDLGPGRTATGVVPGVAGDWVPGGETPGPSGAAPSGRPSSGPPSSGAASPGTSGSSGPSGSPGAAGSGRPPRVATHQETWSGRGGYVTARCRGAQAGLVAAQPDPGYAVAVSDRGPARVEVSFEGRTEDGGRRVEVRAECVGGPPAFQVSTGEGGGGGDD